MKPLADLLKYCGTGLLAGSFLLLSSMAADGADRGSAAIPTSTEQLLASTRNLSGVCVHLGGGESGLMTRLAEGGRLLIHGLEADARKVQVGRAALQSRQLAGQVTIEHWGSPALPYADQLANLLVAEDPGRTSEAEMLRVLAPQGRAFIRQGDGWRMLQKPSPTEYDEWTHARHGADGNMVSHDQTVGVPAGLRWVAGPAQDAGGKKWYYDHVLVSAQGRNFYVYENEITARDAFNGTRLWSRPFKAYTFKETGAEVPTFLQFKAKLATRSSKVRPVAVGNRLYVAAEGRLRALDAATGQTVFELGRVGLPREMLVDSNTLVIADTNAILAYGLAATNLLWQSELNAERIVAGDGTLFALSSNVITAFDLDTGSEIWRTVDTNAIPATTCTYHYGVLALEKSTWRDDPEGCGILVYSGKDGRLLWHKDYRTDQTHYQEARSFFARGLVWLQMQKSRIAGFDPLTGKQKQSYTSRSKHCATPVATEQYFIAPECEFTDLTSGKLTRARMFKSACRLPFIPANGLLYSFPVQCECYPMLRGYMALSHEPVPQPDKTKRLVRGPAFGRAEIPPAVNAPNDEWPMYRRDTYRSGSTPAPLPPGDLKQTWSVQLARSVVTPLAEDWNGNPFVRGPVTSPVAAGGTVVVAVPDEHRVTALDARSGQPRWSFTTGARVDTPPTLHEGLCLFGSHDGWVYCLDTASGELAWKFRAAPVERRIMAYGQMESLWPVPGSVLVDSGVAYFAAGRHPMSDGGVFVYALQPRTGKVVWEKELTDLTLTNWYSPMLTAKQKIGLDFEPMDMLVKDGDSVAMSRWRFNPQNGSYQLQLGSTNYQAPNLAVPRGLWGYGIRQNKMVNAKPAAAFDQSKLHVGSTNDAALLLLAGQPMIASTKGMLQWGTQNFQLEAPPVPDGIIAANGRFYIATTDGKLVCLEPTSTRRAASR